MTDAERVARLMPPKTGILPMVLDTDTANEVDDQFAMSYALLSPERLRVEAIYAAPFFNRNSRSAGDGMEQSYAEILRLAAMIPQAEGVPVFRGATRFLRSDLVPDDNPAARDLIARAMARENDAPLYVVAIGAITNVASALLLEPAIAGHIVVVWLGGHPTHWDHTREFNLWEDVPAAQVLLDSGVPLVLCPCHGVASHLLTTPADLRLHLAGKNALCDALVRLFSAYREDHFAWAKEIWDMLAVGWLVDVGVAPSKLTHTPRLSADGYWMHDTQRPLMRELTYVHRNRIFADMFRKLASL